ncbi:MAG: hypothetical protein CM15mP18_3400 [Methanobacteriota archaeon]|nr:MAG: hypothetical protein CM15mP18_3400 [Euryarchaeota archaeon]
MTAKGMTSVSVSYEVRRQLNTLRSLGGYKSVNEVLLTSSVTSAWRAWTVALSCSETREGHR